MMNQKTTKHNGIISFWKFMFCMMILMLHCCPHVNIRLFRQGYLGVEFFFVVSGYLMASSVFKTKKEYSNIGKNTWNYLWKKIKSLYPYIILSCVFALIYKISIGNFKIINYVNSIWNLLLVDMSGIRTTYILGQTWYISAMLIAMLILYPLLYKYRENFITIGAPIIVLLVGGYISHQYGVLSGVVVWEHIITYGLLRAIMELSLGTILYLLSQKISQIDFTKFGKIILTVIEMGGFLLVFKITSGSSKNYDFIVLLLISISVMLAFSTKTLLYSISNNKFCYYLEQLSLPIYLNHYWIMECLKKQLPHTSGFQLLLLIMIVTIIVSMLLNFIVQILKGKPSKLCKKLFIEKAPTES